MRKESLMFGVLGLVVGLVIGFIGANSINRSVPTPSPVSTMPGSGPLKGNPALPADHPPLGTSAGDPTQGAPLPQVTEAIERAKAQPQDYEAQMTAADLYYQIRRFEDAAKFYEAANKLKPAEAEPTIKLGNALFDAEKYDEAEKWYLLALEKEPRNTTVRTDLGLTFFLREPQDLDRSIKEYQASLAIDPVHEISLQNLAVAYKSKGDTENHRTTIEKLRRINPNNPVVLKEDGR